MYTNQKEALKKVFSLYERFEVMECEAGNNWISYARDIIEAIPELIQAFPSIVLLEMKDDLGILKNVVMKKYKIIKKREENEYNFS